MKKKYLYIAAFASVLIVAFYTIVKANSGGAVYGICGAPDDQVPGSCGSSTQGANCHNINPITDGNALQISLLDATTKQAVNSYQLGKKYIVKIELTYRTLVACGFESTVETATNNEHVGTMAPLTKCQIIQDFRSGLRDYATHINSSRTSAHYGMWQYYWTAPATGQDDIIIYAAGNSADGDGADDRDTIFNTTKTFSRNSGIDNTILTRYNISIYPNPAIDNFNISCSLAQEENTTMDLFNSKGQQVKSIQSGILPQGYHKINADIKGLPTGLYFVRITAGGESAVEKVMIN